MRKKYDSRELAALALARHHGARLTREQLFFRTPNNSLVASKADEPGVITERDYAKNYYPQYEYKLEIAKRFVDLVARRIPWVLSVWVTGSVASGYPQKNDDVDLMIVCDKNRLWISRIVVYILAFICSVKVRKPGDVCIDDKVCLNLWLDSSALRVLPDKENSKNALDLLLAVCILDNKNTYAKLIRANTWIDKYYKQGYISLLSKIHTQYADGYTTSSTFDIVYPLEVVAYFFQNLWMKRKIKQEKVGRTWAYFHPEG